MSVGPVAGKRNPEATDSELRLGLVLYGGVSLAIYIYGVVIEVQRLLAAAQDGNNAASHGYRSALDAAGVARARVDVIAGTSAGGINGILLATALATGGDVREARDLWLDGADFADLLRGPRDGGPDSLLNTELMEDRITEGLKQVRGSRSPRSEDVLDLFVSATHLRGSRRRFQTALGTNIGTLVHRYVFRLKLRGRYRRQELDSPATLVKLARATSSFPVAFDPVELTVDDGLLGARDESSGWFADGGILNNKPFTEALGAIYTRESDLRVKRWLLSVDPDPKGLYDGEAPGEKPDFVEVAGRALVGIPRYQSIAADLERLEEHNAEVRRTAGALLSLERQLSPSASVASWPPYTPARWRWLGDGDDAAYWHMRDQAWAGAIAERIITAVEPRDPHEFDRGAVHEAVSEAVLGRVRQAWQKRDPGPLDLAYERRRVYYLIKLVSMAQESAASADGEEAAEREDEEEEVIADADALLRVKAGLWQAFDSIQGALWEWFADQALDLELGLRELPEASDAEVAAAMADPLVRNALLGGQGGFVNVNAPPLAEAQAGIADTVADAVGDVVVRIDPTAVDGAAGEADGDGVFSVNLRGVFEDFPRRDSILLPMEIGGGLRHRDIVSHAQISPMSADATGVPAEAKLAGDTLGRFGGFLDGDWRRNDLLWGRLDAAETLVRAIFSGAPGRREETATEVAAREAAERKAIAAVHEEILADEERDEALTHPHGYAAYLAENAIGDATAAHLPKLRIFTLTVRAARKFRRMACAAWRSRRTRR